MLFRSKDFKFIKTQYERLEAISGSSLGIVKDLSNLNEEWKDILQAVGINEDVPLQHLNSSERVYEKELSTKSIKLIKKYFANDYKILPHYTKVNWE